MQTRKLAVTGLDWEVQPFSQDERDKEVADFVDEQLKGIENFDEVLIDMLDAIGKGISIMELAWTVEDGKNVIEDIEYVHPKKLVWDSTTDELKICTGEYPSGVELPENKFVVHKYKAKSGHASRVVSWMYLFKNYDIKDWVSFCEVFGMPLRLGKYDASASEDDKKQLMEAIISLGTDAAGIVPSSTMIEFIESQKTTSVEIYEKLARYCDEQISKAILGQTLTSDSGGGSYAQSKTHDEVRHDLTVADAKALAVTIRRDIIRPLVEFNFGTDVDIPFFGFDCHEVEDQKEVVEIYKTLACDMGLEIPKSHIYKKFNIPKPEDGEEVLEPPRTGISAQPPPMEEAEELKLKQQEGQTEQGQVDAIVSAANKQAEGIFREMVKPIFKMIDKAADMDELQKVLKDEKKLRELYQEMESPELDDLIQQGIYLSHLIGRSMD
jgi:phage gp29-like protein